MRPYELVVILRPELEDASVQANIDRLVQIIEADGGEVTNVDRWGKRRLAYEIQGHRDGDYTILQFNSQVDVTRELERILQLSEDVIRYMTVRGTEV